ncbi:hypothetical protein FSP39_007883 [Pinctada imbricata]|uniref:peptidylprolyl isomerase n=1 Tax=Pinctada imbricata TaxID=66713 RepID=A0AA88Y2Q0_PINIB|nr:hypothetical protein FSP39_007883 [Pinctada imbricata]
MNCKSKNLIYVMTCPNCGENYVGQTGTKLADRVRVHKQQIRDPSTRNTPCSGHFDMCGGGSFSIFPFYKVKEDNEQLPPELVDEDDTDDDSDDEDMVQVGKKRKVKEAQQGKKKIRTINDIEDDDDDEDDSDFDVTADIDDSLDDEDEDEEPVQSPSKEGKKKGMKSEKKIPIKSEISNSKSEMSTPQADSTDGKKKKKKKKKNKQKAEDNNQENQVKKESKQEKTEAGTPKGGTPKKRVLAGGLMVEEVKGGHGPDAKAGKVVSVYYVGTLAKNGKQFDSCQSGKPFKFRLGKNEVIKGWDQGLQGLI